MKVFVPECVRHFLFLCLTNVNDIYFFMSVLFLSFIVVFILINLLYTIKIDESWRLKLMSACQLFYDHNVDKIKSANFSLSFVSEIHDYDTRSTYLQHLITCTFRINIRRFCSTVIGCYYWDDIPISMRRKPARKHSKSAVFTYDFSQYLLMSSFDHVLLIHLLLKVWFLHHRKPLFYLQ